MTATLLAKRSKRKGLIQRLAEFRHALLYSVLIRKEGEVMPPYLMPLLRSGVIRPCGSLPRFAKVRWVWPSIFRWFDVFLTSDRGIRR